MPTDPPPQSYDLHADSQPAIGAQGTPFARIMMLAQAAATPEEYYRALLGILGEVMGSPFARLSVRLCAETFSEEWHTGPTDPRFWRDAVDRFLVEALTAGQTCARVYSARDARLPVGLLAVPLHDTQGEISGAVALVTRLPRASARARAAYLESLVTVGAYAADFVRRTPAPSAETSAARAMNRAASFESVEELCMYLTNTLRHRLGCQHVALGVVRGPRVRLVSVSGLDHVPRESPGIQAIVSAMDECLDQGTRLVVPPTPDEPLIALGNRLHQQWHRAVHGDQVASLPLQAGGQVVAVLSLRRRPEEPFLAKELDEVEQSAAPYASALCMLRKAERNLVQHAFDAAKGWLSSLLQPRRVVRRWGVLACAAFLAWFVFGTYPYGITVYGTVRPAVRRHVSMPFDGKLLRTLCKPGDTARAGVTLAELDDAELQLQQRELEAQRAVAEAERLAALGRNDPVAAQMATVNIELYSAKLARLAERLAQTRLSSPVDGIVISGELEPQLGAVVPRGTPLFEIAATGTWRVELELPEWSSPHVHENLPGELRLEAHPETAIPFLIERVLPRTAPRDGRNVLVAEATVHAADPAIRPGLAGYARVEVGPRPVWWVALHRVIDYFRVHLWL